MGRSIRESARARLAALVFASDSRGQICPAHLHRALPHTIFWSRTGETMTISDFGATRERGRALDMGGSARYADGMPEDPEEQKQSEKPSSDAEEGKVRIPLSGTAIASAQI